VGFDEGCDVLNRLVLVEELIAAVSDYTTWDYVLTPGAIGGLSNTHGLSSLNVVFWDKRPKDPGVRVTSLFPNPMKDLRETQECTLSLLFIRNPKISSSYLTPSAKLPTLILLFC
jgi:hypothetical protein